MRHIWGCIVGTRTHCRDSRHLAERLWRGLSEKLLLAVSRNFKKFPKNPGKSLSDFKTLQKSQSWGNSARICPWHDSHRYSSLRQYLKIQEYSRTRKFELSNSKKFRRSTNPDPKAVKFGELLSWFNSQAATRPQTRDFLSRAGGINYISWPFVLMPRPRRPPSISATLARYAPETAHMAQAHPRDPSRPEIYCSRGQALILAVGPRLGRNPPRSGSNQ